MSSQAPKVDVVTTQVIKIVAYQDELQSQWSALRARPVRHALDQIPELSDELRSQKVIDVWDRQWLSSRLERVHQDHTRAIMQRSGTCGYYYEPRALDGRSHNEEYKVIWLNRVDKQEALVQCQSLKQWACIVRSNKRFGVRALTSEAEAVHQEIKPATPFLGGGDLLEFVGGPFPYGATPQSLTKLFQTWGWTAKPCQPRSRSSDGKGILWFIQSTEKPPYEVYQESVQKERTSPCRTTSCSSISQDH